MRKLLVIIFLLIFFDGCDTEIFPESDPQITVEGWIDEGGHPIVLLTQAVSVDDEARSLSDLSNYIVKWAKVTVSDGEHSEILTGKFNQKYYPPFIYTTSNITGEAGKTYSLLVEYKDFTLTAQTTIPSRVEIDTAFAVPTESDSSQFGIRVIFRDNPDTHDFYKTFSNCDSSSNMFLSTIMQTIDDQFVSGTKMENTIYRGRFLDTDYQPNFSRGEVVKVKLCHIDSLSYQFWHAYENSLSFSRNALLRYNQNLPGNIVGGFGYWCGYGASVRRVEVK